MSKPLQKSDPYAVAGYERWLAHAVLLGGLVGWVIFDPPPHRWLPVAVLTLVLVTVTIREFYLAKQRRKSNSREANAPGGN